MTRRSPALRVAALAVLGVGGTVAFGLQSMAPTPATDVPAWRVDQRAEQVGAFIDAARVLSLGWVVLMLSVVVAGVLLLVDLVLSSGEQTDRRPTPVAVQPPVVTVHPHFVARRDHQPVG